MEKSEIENEEIESRKYKIKKGNDKLAEITLDNVAKIEAMIITDSRYEFDEEEFGGKKDGYDSSYTFWINELKENFKGKGPNDSKKIEIKGKEYRYKDVISEIINAIDRSNSTHLNAYGNGREEIANRLCSDPCNSYKKLIELLKNKDKKYELIEIISEEIVDKDKKTKKGENIKRMNFSFATKFCHYMSFVLFKDEDKEYRDGYSIYDNILAKTVPAYAKKYKLNLNKDSKLGLNFNKNKNNFDLDWRKYKGKNNDVKKLVNFYDGYQKLIDKIRKEAVKEHGSKEVSRNGFDYLLWYYYKGRQDEIEKYLKK